MLCCWRESGPETRGPWAVVKDGVGELVLGVLGIIKFFLLSSMMVFVMGSMCTMVSVEKMVLSGSMGTMLTSLKIVLVVWVGKGVRTVVVSVTTVDTVIVTEGATVIMGRGAIVATDLA